MLPTQKSTKPVEFKFQVDARLEARKSESEKERALASSLLTRKQTHPVPDFKALHALHEAELALRKENIAPTIPIPIEFKTVERVREREKFDEHIREKERELARVMEQRRREKEEEEEREVRELRKRAIPKAHEVPEWYKEAPKKKTIDEDPKAD